MKRPTKIPDSDEKEQKQQKDVGWILLFCLGLVVVMNILLFNYMYRPLQQEIEQIQNELWQLDADIHANILSDNENSSDAFKRPKVTINSRHKRSAAGKTRSRYMHLVMDNQRIPSERQHSHDSREDQNKQGSLTFNTWKENQRGNDQKPLADFNETSGIVSIKQRGLYLIYAQMTQNHNAPYANFTIMFENDVSSKKLATCVGLDRRFGSFSINSTVSQCFTNRAMYLKKNDQLYITGNSEGYRGIITQRTHTFWGLAKFF